MQEANLATLIEDILVIMLIYYAIKFLARLFLPFLAKKAVEKASEQFQQQQQQKNSTQNQSTEKPKEKKIVGEYVDFEEIE